MPGPILRVGIATPLLRLFDYCCPDHSEGDNSFSPGRGKRVCVPFGKKTRIGVIVAITDTSAIPAAKLRKAIRIIDGEPLLDESIMAMIEWSAEYYRHAPGEVIAAALPGLLRKGGAIDATEIIWHATEQSRNLDITTLSKRAPVQARIVELILQDADGADATLLATAGKTWRTATAKLVDKGLLTVTERRVASAPACDGKNDQGNDTPPTLTEDQRIGKRDV